MHKLLMIWFCLWPLLFLSAVAEYDEPQDISATEGLPSSLVNHSVCAISGEYIDSVVDVVLPGPEPLVISRVYTSFAESKPWTFNHYEKLIVGNSIYDGIPVHMIAHRQPSGARLDYVFRKEGDYLKLKDVSFDLVTPKGLTNCATMLSGKTNIKNQTLVFYPDKEKIEVVTGAGNKKIFKKEKSGHDDVPICGQTTEIKVNGSNYKYKGDGKGLMEVSEITCENHFTKQPFSSVHFDEYGERDKRVQTMLTSDGRKYKYYFEQHKYHLKNKTNTSSSSTLINRFYLTKVDHEYAPEEEYQYHEKARSRDKQLSCKSRDKGRRFVKIEYYHEGENHVADETVNIKDDEDFRLDRVKKLRSPVGTNQTPITTHSFDYQYTVKKHKRTGQKKTAEGHTNVYDAYKHKTRYDYDEEHRLTSIKRYTGKERSEYAPYFQECFLWGEKKHEEGCLLGKIFKDGNGNHHHARYFTYDKRGNVLTKAFCGSLTGNFPIGNGEERETKHYTYSDDGLNLLLTETDARGKTIRYVYEGKSDRLKAKYTEYDGRIRLREFYFYDENYALEKKLIDDGIHEAHEDLREVTERHITFLKPRKKAPIGLPETIEERYFDPKLNEEIPLKKSLFAYSPEGRKLTEQVFDADLKHVYTLEWDYDKHGNLIYEKNAEGEVITKEYDLATDNLIYQKSSSVPFYTRYAYDYSNRLIEQREIHDDKQEFTISYSYDYLSNCIATVNAYGHETKQTYDEFGRVTQITYPQVPNGKGILIAPLVSKTYNIVGLPVSVIDANGGETKFNYNSRCQPIKIIYPDGTHEEMRYEIDGQLKQKIAKNGACTEYTRDPLGRVLIEKVTAGGKSKEIKNRYNAFHLLESADPEGGVATYTYDYAGRLKRTCKHQRRTENFYDSLGRLNEIREYYGDQEKDYRATIKKYDLLDRVVEECLHSSDGALLHFSCFRYDQRSNCILSQTGDQILVTEYNAQNQPIKITDSLGHATHITFDRYFYNSYGQRVLQTTSTDPLGCKTIDTYDTADRLVETIRLNPLGKKVSLQSIFYDLCGNKTGVEEEVIEQGRIIRTIRNQSRYNAANQIVEVIEAAGTPEQKVTRMLYNIHGQKEALVKPDGTMLRYAYDPFGRLQTLNSSDQSISYLYEYNLLDQLTKATDLLTKQTTERTYFQDELEKEILGNGLSLKYTYDKTGRTRTVTFPDQTGVEYCYDAVDLKEVHRLINGKRAYTHCDLQHSLSGQILKVQLPGNNGTASYTYDPLGHCTSIDSRDYHLHVPSEGFDAAGNLLKFESQNTSYSFTYDDCYQLNSEMGHASHQYCFDSISNRTAKDGEAHHNNSLNQLTQKGKEEFCYDLNGNFIRWIKDSKITHYTYDALDRLIAIESDGKTTYEYDAFNRRLRKINQAQEELFVYQGQEEIGKWKNGRFQELRLLGQNSRSPMISLELKGVPYVPLHDLSGNLVCLSNHQGEVIERYRYTAFGECEIFSATNQLLACSAIGNSWQYASKRRDEESGLIAFGLRYYEPSLGRWISPDPAGDSDGPNLYAYVHNNPLRYFDQFGLYADEFDLSWDPIFPDYYIASFDDIHNGFAGALHGGADFVTHQIAGVGAMCCAIGSNDCEDRQERFGYANAFGKSCAGHLNRFDNWFVNSLGVDPNNTIYQDLRSVTNMTLEVGSLAISGYGIAKTGFKVAELYALSLQAEKLTGKLALNEVKFNSTQRFLATLDSRINQLSGINQGIDLNALSKAGQVMDRCALTRAGRALDKHGGRPGSAFPKAIGNPINKNLQGQFQLDDILTHPQSTSFSNRFEGFDIFAPDGRGIRFDAQRNFTGFLQPRRII